MFKLVKCWSVGILSTRCSVITLLSTRHDDQTAEGKESKFVEERREKWVTYVNQCLSLTSLGFDQIEQTPRDRQAGRQTWWWKEISSVDYIRTDRSNRKGFITDVCRYSLSFSRWWRFHNRMDIAVKKKQRRCWGKENRLMSIFSSSFFANGPSLAWPRLASSSSSHFFWASSRKRRKKATETRGEREKKNERNQWSLGVLKHVDVLCRQLNKSIMLLFSSAAAPLHDRACSLDSQ